MTYQALGGEQQEFGGLVSGIRDHPTRVSIQLAAHNVKQCKITHNKRLQFDIQFMGYLKV